MILPVKNLENSLQKSVVGVTYVSRHYSIRTADTFAIRVVKKVKCRAIGCAPGCRLPPPGAARLSWEPVAGLSIQN